VSGGAEKERKRERGRGKMEILWEKKEEEDSEKPATDKKAKTKKVKETVQEWEQQNENKAVWLRPIEEIEDEEYNKFYKTISKDYQDPMTWVHFKGEGEIEFSALLYVPKKAPYSWMEQEDEKKSNLKLYVRRVLISEDFKDLMPRWLSFVKGVVDSDDLPLNVSRESLQQMRALKTIRKRLIKKVLDKLESMAKQKVEDEDKDKDESELSEEEKQQKEEKRNKRKAEVKDKYEKFWQEFGKSIKLGVIDDSTHRDKLAELLLFKSTFNETNSFVSLSDYKSRMIEGQKDIYYLSGDSVKTIYDSPLVRAMMRKKMEVLLMDQPIDEYMVQQLQKFEGSKIVNIGKSGFELPVSDEEKTRQRKLEKYFEPLITWLEKTLPNTPKVKINPILSGLPLVVLAGESGYSA